MLDCVYFRAWVANTVWELSGIWCLDWQGSQRKSLLTIEETRDAACQEAFAEKFADKNQAAMRAARLGVANLTPDGQILH